MRTPSTSGWFEAGTLEGDCESLQLFFVIRTPTTAPLVFTPVSSLPFECGQDLWLVSNQQNVTEVTDVTPMTMLYYERLSCSWSPLAGVPPGWLAEAGGSVGNCSQPPGVEATSC